MNQNRSLENGALTSTIELARVLALDETSRTIRHVISTGTLDRSNRMVEPNGWKLSTFRENPVVLANHDYSIENIIGTATDVRVENDALVSTTRFAETGLGDVAFRLVQAGLARSWSVGWKGMKLHRIGEVEDCARCQAAGKVDYGVHYTQQELLEYSLVAIPANPDAVMGLQAAGLLTRRDVGAWQAWERRSRKGPATVPERVPIVSGPTFARGWVDSMVLAAHANGLGKRIRSHVSGGPRMRSGTEHMVEALAFATSPSSVALRNRLLDRLEDRS